MFHKFYYFKNNKSGVNFTIVNINQLIININIMHMSCIVFIILIINIIWSMSTAALYYLIVASADENFCLNVHQAALFCLIEASVKSNLKKIKNLHKCQCNFYI